MLIALTVLQIYYKNVLIHTIPLGVTLRLFYILLTPRGDTL